MGVQLIADFNPTHKMYAVGDEKHAECLIEGTFGDNFNALVPMIAKFIYDSADSYAEHIPDEDKEKIMDECKNKGLNIKDMVIITLWKKFSDKVNEELVKLKIMGDLNIPDFMKEVIPEELILGYISNELSKLKEESEDE